MRLRILTPSSPHVLPHVALSAEHREHREGQSALVAKLNQLVHRLENEFKRQQEVTETANDAAIGMHTAAVSCIYLR